MITNLFERNGYLAKVFLTLIVQLFITFLTVYALRNHPKIMAKIFTWSTMLILFLVMLGLLIAIVQSSLSNSVKFILFCMFSVTFGLLLSPIGLFHREILIAAAGGTVCIFVLMFLAGAIFTYYKVNLSTLGLILLACLIGLIVGSLVSWMVGVRPDHIGWVIFGLVVYALLVMYDTQVILSRQLGDNYIAGAMSFYLDVLGIFLRLLQLGNRK